MKPGTKTLYQCKLTRKWRLLTVKCESSWTGFYKVVEDPDYDYFKNLLQPVTGLFSHRIGAFYVD